MNIVITNVIFPFFVQLLPIYLLSLDIYKSLFVLFVQQLIMYGFHRFFHQYLSKFKFFKSAVHYLHHKNIKPHDTLEKTGWLFFYAWYEPVPPFLCLLYYEPNISVIYWFYGVYLSFLDHLVAHRLCHIHKEDIYEKLPSIIKYVADTNRKIHEYHHRFPNSLQYSGFNLWLDFIFRSNPPI